MNNIKSIWIESEEKGAILGGELETNDNSDVIVTMQNGEKYVATFFTYKNIEWLRQKNEKTGECLSGKYFWASDLILIDKLNRTEILKVIEDLFNESEFNSVFNKMNE